MVIEDQNKDTKQSESIENEAVQKTEKMILIKESDIMQMKEILFSFNQDRADKEAFADVTRRLMYLVYDLPKKTEDIKKILDFFNSCFSNKNGKRKFSIINLGKKLITKDLPFEQLLSLSDALNLKAFDNYQSIDYADAFKRNQIPVIDIAPLIEAAKTLFTHPNK